MGKNSNKQIKASLTSRQTQIAYKQINDTKLKLHPQNLTYKKTFSFSSVQMLRQKVWNAIPFELLITNKWVIVFY